MSKKGKKENDNIVPFLISDNIDVGSFEAHSRTKDTIYAGIKELKDEWNSLIESIYPMFEKMPSSLGDKIFIDEVNMQIGFNAKGKLVFVAEAGADVRFSVKFKINQEKQTSQL